MAFIFKDLSFLKFIKVFGLFRGLSIYYKFRHGKKGVARIPDVKHPLHFRPKTADWASFWEIFIKNDYNIAYPKFWETPKVIIDAGANIGFTTVFYANKYPDAKIFSIEPEESNFKLLEKNVASYNNQTVSIQNAIWVEKAYVKVVDKGFGTRSFMIEESDKNDKEALLALSINDLIQQYKLDTIDILKIDIEGTEKFLFDHNVDRWLPKVKCLIVEFHDFRLQGCSKSVFKAISKYNFSCKMKGDNLVFYNEDFVPQTEENFQEMLRVLHPSS